MIKTVAEAEAEDFTLPEFSEWRRFAGGLSGYTIAEELNLDFSEWTIEQTARWKETNRWDLDVLHLRVMLFYTLRLDYWTGYTYTEHDGMADSLLQAISQKTGKAYTPKS